MAGLGEQENKTATAETEAARQEAQERAARSNASSVVGDFSHRQAEKLIAAFKQTPPEASYPEAQNTLKRESIATKIAQHFQRNRRAYFIALLGLVVGISVGIILYFAFPFALAAITGFIGLTVVPSLFVGLLPGLTLPIFMTVLVGAAAILSTALLGGLALRINHMLSGRSAAATAKVQEEAPVNTQSAESLKEAWKEQVKKLDRFAQPSTNPNVLEHGDKAKLDFSKLFLTLLTQGVNGNYEKTPLLTCLQKAKEHDPRATKGLDIEKTSIHTAGITQADRFYISLYNLINAEYPNEEEIMGRIEFLQGNISLKKAETLPPGWEMHMVEKGDKDAGIPFYYSKALKTSVWTVEKAQQIQKAHDATQPEAKGLDAELTIGLSERQRVSSASLASANSSANTGQDPLAAAAACLEKIKAAESPAHTALSSPKTTTEAEVKADAKDARRASNSPQ